MNRPSPYSCSTSEADLNRFLDGEPRDLIREYIDHLADCALCRSLHRAAEAFSSLPPVTPPSDLPGRILAAVLADRPRPTVKPSRGRSLPFGVAVAASLLVCLLLGSLWLGGSRKVPVKDGVVRTTRSAEIASVAPLRLKDRISSAGSALLDRTRKATTESIPNIPLGNAFAAAPVRTPAETFTTIDRVGSGAGSTLAPIASSTRRMFDLVRRELPAVEPHMKPNS